MKIIKTKVIGDTITPIEQGYVIENQVNQYVIEFDFDETWDFEEKYCIFQDEFEEQIFKRAIINNQVIVPSELLNGRITIQVYGQNIEDDVITQRQPSLKYVFSILNSLPVNASEEQDVPTPTQWELYISQIEEMCNDLQDQFDDLKEECETKCDDVIEKIAEAEQDIQTNTDNIRANTEAIDKLNTDLLDYSLITETGNKLSVSIDSNYLMTITLKDKNNNILSTASVDFPIESAIINATYNNATKEITFTLQNGNTLVVPIGDIISGLASQSDLEALANRVETIENDYLTSADKTELQESITNLDNEIELEQQAQDNSILALQNENERLSRIVEGLPTKQANGTSFVLNDMVKANIKDYELRGNTTQNGTPTPDNPVAIQTATGNQEINVFGKNLISVLDEEFSKTYSSQYSIQSIVLNNEIKLEANKQYTIQFKIKSNNSSIFNKIYLYATGFVTIKELTFYGRTTTNYEEKTATFTLSEDAILSRIGFQNEDVDTFSFKDIQIEFGSTASEYEKFTQQTKTISLGDIELNKIGDYQDRIYKQCNKWYLEKNINKVILNSTMNWSLSQTNTDTLRFGSNVALTNGLPTNSIKIICNKFVNGSSTTDNGDYEHIRSAISEFPEYLFININKTRVENLDKFKNWLNNNNVIVYYILETPITTEITDTALISQLEDVYNIILNENNTIIINGNLPSDTLVIGYADIAKLISSLSSQDSRSVDTKKIEEPIEEPIETKEEER